MLILASKSPIRKTLLDNAGLHFLVASAPIDEREIEDRLLTQGENRQGLAVALAKSKALAVSKANPGAVVLGADQTFDQDGEGRHKPATIAEAARNLMAMAGTSHSLHSGVALARDGEIVWSAVDTATLAFKDFSRAELDLVLRLEGEAILGSVGGYRLEGPSVRLFSRVQGDYFTILGLPLLALLDALAVHAPETLSQGEER